MEKRRLGNSDLWISPLVLGANVFGWTIGEKTAHTLLDSFIDRGFETLDTADVYSSWVPGNTGGESETIIGNWFKNTGNRDKITLITKVGNVMEGNPEPNNTREYIITAVERSLKRLQTDYIDLYFNHIDDKTTPVEETLEAYHQLIQQGKVRFIGTSNMSAKRIENSLSASNSLHIPRYEVIQPEYNLYSREQYETVYEPLAEQHKLGVITYFSLACGFLTGKYRSENDLSKSQRGNAIKNMLNDRGYRILKALDEISYQFDTHPANVALNWIMKRPSVTAPIASATSIEQLKMLMDSVSLDLNPEAIEVLNNASK